MFLRPPFSPIFSSPATSLTTPAASPALSTGIRPNPCATPLGDGLPGHLAGPIPNTGHEPKFCIDVDSERAHADQPSVQKHEITASVDLNLPRHSGASSSSQHLAASKVSTLSKLGASGTSLPKVLADRDSVVGRTSIKETCADMERETVFSSLVESVSREKRDRDLNVVQSSRDRQHLHTILERKAELAVRGGKLAQLRFYEAGADVEMKHWEKKNSDISLYEINQEFESQRLQLQKEKQRANQQRDKISLYGELEMRNRLIRKHQAKDCQEIEELKRTCCEEADRARQARIDESSMHQERNPMTVSPLLTLIREYHLFRVILDCRTIHKILWERQNVFERLPAREGQTSTLQQFQEFGNLFLRIET